MPAPAVSVLMTAYNRESYIAPAIESVLNSTFSDLELIVVDDGSTDRTVDIARDYERADSRVSVYVNESNLGDYANRNRAATYARGRYVKYVDSDDQLYSHGLGVMVSVMERFPDAAYGLSCFAGQSAPFPILKTPAEAYTMHYFGSDAVFTRSPLSAIIRRSAFERAGGFPELRMVGDYAMWHKLSQREQLVLMPPGLAWYRVHEGQEMADTRRSPAEFESRYDTISLDALRSDACPLSREQCALIARRRVRQVRRKIVKSALYARGGDLAIYRRLHGAWAALC